MIAATVRREAEAAGLQPLAMSQIPTRCWGAVLAWTHELHAGCAHVERGAFGLAVMPHPRIMCPEHVALLDLENRQDHCSRCGVEVTGEPGTIAGFIAPSDALWLLVTFCSSCTSGGTP